MSEVFEVRFILGVGYTVVWYEVVYFAVVPLVGYCLGDVQGRVEREVGSACRCEVLTVAAAIDCAGCSVRSGLVWSVWDTYVLCAKTQVFARTRAFAACWVEYVMHGAEWLARWTLCW